MTVVAALALVVTAGAAAEITPAIVQAPGSPVRIDRARVLNAGSEEPAVLLYSATNTTDQDLEHFTVMAFIFDAEGTLKARQVAPARHMLEKGTTKYSTMVLDGWKVTPADRVVIGVNQAQRVGSDDWWHGELESAAGQAIKGK